jgi:hypothetical protein
MNSTKICEYVQWAISAQAVYTVTTVLCRIK